MTTRRLTLDSGAIATRTGRGVRVAVVDSGIAAGHPHVGAVAGGIALVGDEPTAFGDRIGHGTAVASAIREKAPDIELLAVRVFDRELATSASRLADALRWCADQGAHVINLSLGTHNEDHRALLSAALAYVASRGALIVAACEVDGRAMFPGALQGAVGVRLAADCPRDELRLYDDRSRVIVGASGYPRPIPGVPPERNLYGISFAVANVSGFVARLAEGEALISASQVAERVSSSGSALPNPAFD